MYLGWRMLFGFVFIVVVFSSINNLGLVLVEVKSSGSDKVKIKGGVLGVEKGKNDNVGL